MLFLKLYLEQREEVCKNLLWIQHLMTAAFSRHCPPRRTNQPASLSILTVWVSAPGRRLVFCLGEGRHGGGEGWRWGIGKTGGLGVSEEMWGAEAVRWGRGGGGLVVGRCIGLLGPPLTHPFSPFILYVVQYFCLSIFKPVNPLPLFFGNVYFSQMTTPVAYYFWSPRSKRQIYTTTI